MRFNLLKMFQGRQSSIDRRRREQLSRMNDLDDGFSDRFNDHFNDNLRDSMYGYQAVRPLEAEISDNNDKFLPPPIEIALPSDSPRRPIIDDDEEDDGSFIHVDSPSSVMSGVIPNVHRQDDEHSPFGLNVIAPGGLERKKSLPPQRIPSRYTPSAPRPHEKARRYTEEDVIVLSTTESDTSVSNEPTDYGKPRASARLDRMNSSSINRPRRMNYAPQPVPYTREPTVVFTNSVNEEIKPSHEPYQYAREGYEQQRVIAIPSTTSSSMYYIVPGGMNVIFQDENGNEITRVGDFSGRRPSPSAPFVVQDKHGREIYRHGKIDESNKCSHHSTCRDIEGHLLVFNPCQCKNRSRSHTFSPRDNRSRSGSGSSSDRHSAPSRSGYSGRYSSEIISGHHEDYASKSPRSYSSHHSHHSSHSSNTESSSNHDRSHYRRDRNHDRERERERERGRHHNNSSGSRRYHA